MKSFATGLSKLPIVTLTLTAFAAIAFVTNSGDILAYSRESVATEPWRLFTCHWVHWSGSHLFWSAGMFALLGGICERIDRRVFTVSTVLSAAAIPIVLYAFNRDLSNYGGLSGIDSTLLILLLAWTWVASVREQAYATLCITGAIAFGFLAKIGFEIATGTAYFAGADGGMVPVPLAHLMGAAVGICVAFGQAWMDSQPLGMMKRTPKGLEGGQADELSEMRCVHEPL